MADLPKDLTRQLHAIRTESLVAGKLKEIDLYWEHLAQAVKTRAFRDDPRSFVATMTTVAGLISDIERATKPAPAAGDGHDPMNDAEVVPVVTALGNSSWRARG